MGLEDPGDDDSVLNKCSSCEVEITDETDENKCIKCKICDKIFHGHCVSMSKAIVKSTRKNRNLSWCCDSCYNESEAYDDIIRKMSEVETFIKLFYDEFQGKMNNMQSEIKSVKQFLGDKNSQHAVHSPLQSSVLKRRFADVLCDVSDIRTPVTNKVQRRGDNEFKVNVDVRPILVVKNKDANKIMSQVEIETLKNSIKSSVNPSTDPVKCLRETRKGKIIVECKDTASINIIRQKIVNGVSSDIQVEEPQSTSPIIKLIGLSEFDTNEVLIKDIRKQNDSVMTMDTKLEILSVIKTARYYTATMKCDTKTFENIMQRQRLFVRWDSVRVVQLNTGVTRCYKCAHYNHMSKECTENEYSCPKCAGPHQIKDCHSEDVKCINCVRSNAKLNLSLPTDHFVWSSDCPVFQRKLRNSRGRIRFDK